MALGRTSGTAETVRWLKVRHLVQLSELAHGRTSGIAQTVKWLKPKIQYKPKDINMHIKSVTYQLLLV